MMPAESWEVAEEWNESRVPRTWYVSMVVVIDVAQQAKDPFRISTGHSLRRTG